MKQSPTLTVRMLVVFVVTESCTSSIVAPGLALVTTTREGHEENAEQGCLEKCNVRDRRMECIDCIPSNVTPAVNEIVLTDFNSSNFVPHMFCGVSWPRVVNLTIVNENSVKIDEAFGIGNLTFDCLHEIETLKLDFQVLKNLSRNALYGLDNVIIIDFTHCIHLEVPELTIALSLDTNIPKLQRLILNNLGTAVDGIQLSQEFIDKLAHRKIQSLDMISTTVGFVNPSVNVDKICDSLKTFNLANSLILHSHFENVSPCYSLRVLNLSGAKLPRFPFPSGNITIPPPVPPVVQVSPLWYTFFSTVSVIYLNNIISPDHYIFLNNATLSIQVENSLTEIHLSGYSIPVCELKFKVNPNHVKHLDLSNNKIERLRSDSLAYLEHLERIDLSYNRLSVSEQFDNTLSFIFRNNSKLEITELSHNGLTNLPSDMFKLNTELKRIDLSNNEVTQISFEILHLNSLELLDLRENAVEYLNVWSRHQIDILYKNKQSETEIKPFTVDLRDNPFSCKCHSLDFIKWFVQSPVFDDSRDLYYCEIDGKRLSMNIGAIEAGQYDCEKWQRETRRLLIIVLVPCGSTGLLVVMAIVLFKRYKRQKLLRRIREQIYLIREDQSDYRFPVFLSYSSEDSEFVEPNILQPLAAELKKLTDCDRDLVAIGDRYFRLGRSIFAEIIQMLEDCAVFVVVLSKNYCYSDYCKHEIEQARLMRKPIVIITKEFVDEADMNGVIKETFKHFTRATFRFEEEDWRLEQDWEYVCQSIIQLL